MARSLEEIVAGLGDLGARMESIGANHEPTDDLNEVAYGVYTLLQCVEDLGLWVEDLAKRLAAAGH